MRGARFTRWLVLAAVGAAVAVAVLGSWRTPDASAISGYLQTATGPLGPADRDALVRVKQAGLWEMPAGTEMARRGQSARVRQIGQKIADEHRQLDAITNTAAAELGVPLPAEPTVEQQSWIAQISASDPASFDRTAVNLLRQAHGKVLPLLTSVRTGTRNETIRTFTNDAMAFVQRHCVYLESTNLVDYAALPEPPAPVPLVSPVKTSYYFAADRPTLVLAVLVVLGLAVTALLITRNLMRRRPRRAARESRHRRA